MREIEFRALEGVTCSREPRKFITGSNIRISPMGDTKCCLIEGVRCEYDTLCRHTGLKDKNGAKIFYDSDIFSFEFYDNYDAQNYINLTGLMTFNDDEQRAEIDICRTIEHRDFVCLFFNAGTMRNFEVIGNIHQNANLLTEGE